MKPAIIVGCKTDHGGTISEGEARWLVDGKAVHLSGMKHFCPKCKVVATAIPSGANQNIFGKMLIVAGDKASCGATFIANQNLVVAERTSSAGSTASSTTSKSNFLPSQQLFDEQFILKTDNDVLLANTPYTIKMADGSFKHGTSDDLGKTDRIGTEQAEKLEIYIGHFEE